MSARRRRRSPTHASNAAPAAFEAGGSSVTAAGVAELTGVRLSPGAVDAIRAAGYRVQAAHGAGPPLRPAATEEEAWRAAARDGRETGLRDAREAALSDARAEGFREGREAGRKADWRAGFKAGFKAARDPETEAPPGSGPPPLPLFPAAAPPDAIAGDRRVRGRCLFRLVTAFYDPEIFPRGVCRATNGELAEMFGFNVGSVRRALARLEELDYLRRSYAQDVRVMTATIAGPGAEEWGPRPDPTPLLPGLGAEGGEP